MSFSRECRDIVKGLFEARRVSSTGTAVIGEKGKKTLEENHVPITVLRKFGIRTEKGRVFEYEVSLENLDATFEKLRNEPEPADEPAPSGSPSGSSSGSSSPASSTVVVP